MDSRKWIKEYSLQDKGHKLLDHHSMEHAEYTQIPWSAWETDFKRNSFPSNGTIPQTLIYKDVKTQAEQSYESKRTDLREVSKLNVQVQVLNLEYHLWYSI